MARVGLVLARYKFSAGTGALSFQEQVAFFERLNKARPIAYRNRSEDAASRDTYIIRPSQGEKNEIKYLSWIVCREINHRQVRKVNRIEQTLSVEFEETDDCEVATVVAIPGLGVAVVEDATGDGHIGGWSAIKRTEAMVTALDERFDFAATLAGTAEDLNKAITTWDLERFTFQARPFNPHPSTPGLILSSMLEKDSVGELRGVVLPRRGQHIAPHDDGIVKEAMGLADKGYAVYGADGRTPSGAEARVRKQKFSLDRAENLKNLAGPQQLRVYIDANNDEEKIVKMVDVLLEFFTAGGEDVST